MRLGAGLYDILTALKNDQKRFPKIDISYSSRTPLSLPVIVELSQNGLRLRFDGPEQRLRLIEIIDLEQDQFTVKNESLISTSDVSNRPGRSPLLYRRVYQLFGASYPGEFIPSVPPSPTGTYVVSYPGIALSFTLESSAWSPEVDHAKMLADRMSTVSSIAVFEGKSWAEARKHLFTGKSNFPQSLSNNPRQREGLPDEIDNISIQQDNKIEFFRRTNLPVTVTIGKTTAQDLINDFGPPDSTFKRPGDTSEGTIRPSRGSRRRSSSVVPRSFGSTPSSLSSTNTDTYDADFEEDDGIDGPDIVRPEDQYYCYFHHGFDVLVGSATEHATGTLSSTASQPVATRIIFHGNVPGSFEFNRHRRCRWTLARTNDNSTELTSESSFPTIHEQLVAQFKNEWPERDMREGMVIVRDWAGDSPSNSAILIGESADEEEEESWGHEGGDKWLKNTQLYKFPGLMFEVMHNGAITALTVY